MKEGGLLINNNDSKRYKPRGGDGGNCDEPVTKGLKGNGAPSPKILVNSSKNASIHKTEHISATTVENITNAVSNGRACRGEHPLEKATGATAKRASYA